MRTYVKSVVTYGRLKTKESCKPSSLVVAVANERSSFTRGKVVSSREVVAYERWSKDRFDFTSLSSLHSLDAFQ